MVIQRIWVQEAILGALSDKLRSRCGSSWLKREYVVYTIGMFKVQIDFMTSIDSADLAQFTLSLPYTQ